MLTSLLQTEAVGKLKTSEDAFENKIKLEEKSEVERQLKKKFILLSCTDFFAGSKKRIRSEVAHMKQNHFASSCCIWYPYPNSPMTNNTISRGQEDKKYHALNINVSASETARETQRMNK